ncbi:MAG: hypothetical protein Q4F31_06935 [Eubacteriales bacterium]|nr:hypothetical protein [Eubacteriales bacterium]
MTFEEAMAIARKLNGNINCCHEYQSAYHFFDKTSDADGDCGIVIMKETGKAMHFVQFLLDYSPEKKFVERSM